MSTEISYVRILITLLFGLTWGLAGFGKILERKVPDWFLNQFGSSFMARFPGVKASYWSIGLAELLAMALCVVSVVRLEFFVNNDPLFLKWALVCSMMIFVMLGFGQRLTNDFAGSANSFQYFVGTLVCYAFLELVPKPF